jgi:hypothetical protein
MTALALRALAYLWVAVVLVPTGTMVAWLWSSC